MKSPRHPLHCLYLPIFLICLGMIASGCNREEKKSGPPLAQAVMVTTQAVAHQEVVYTLEQVGSLQASDHALLRAQIDGAVAQIHFQEGSRVAKGQILVNLDDAKIQAEIRNLLARIDQLKVRLAFKGKTLERNRALLKKSAIPQHRFDELESEVKETELAISQVQADLARQRERLTDTVIRAPFAGVVGAKNISVGDYLKTGDRVVEVVVLDPLEISFSVAERYKAKMSLGQKVSLRVAAQGEHRFEGTIFFVSPTVEVKTRTFLVKARVANPKSLLNPGMFARVSLVTEVHPKAAVVPWESVVQTEKETYIYMLEGDKARKTPIQLGQVTSQMAEVIKPDLPAGAPVIVEGKFAAKDGAKVQVKSAPTPTAPKQK